MAGRTPGDLGRLLALVPDPAVAADQDGIVIACNDGAAQLFGTARSSLVGRSVESLMPERHRLPHAAARMRFHDRPGTRPMGAGQTFTAQRADGTEFPVEISLTPVDGDPPVVVAAIRDVSDRERLEASLRHRLLVEQLVSHVASSLVGATGTELDRCIIDGLQQVSESMGADQAFLYVVDDTGAAMLLRHEWCAAGLDPSPGRVERLPRTFGWSRDLLVEGGVTFIRRVDDLPDQAVAERAFMQQAGIISAAAIPLGVGTEYVGTLALRWRTAQAEWSTDIVPLLRVLGDTFLGALRRQSVEETLSHLALHDPLTGLANRTLLHDRIEHELALAGRTDSMVALLFCDLDGFKEINDRHGHAIGDEVLRAVAALLRSSVRPADTVARIGGDEFVVLASVTTQGQVVDLCQRILAALGGPLNVHEHPTVQVSIGVAAVRPAADRAVGAEGLLRQADQAMYAAKSAGGGRWFTAPPDHGHHPSARHSTDPDEVLRQALDDDRFTVVFQPIVRLADGTTLGAEALLRLRDETGTLHEPEEFITQLESSELITRVGREVLHRACQAAVRWRAAAPRAGVTVNLSLRQLMSPDLTRTVKEALDAAGLPAAALHLEITESSLIAGGAIDRLHALKRLGVRVGLDDFGTGYASLIHLRSLPIDFVKVDRAFVSTLHDPRDRTIVGAVLRLCSDLDLDVIVEGVETTAQERLLIGLGAVYAQGYLYGRPMPDAAIHEVLATNVGGATPGVEQAPRPQMPGRR